MANEVHVRVLLSGKEQWEFVREKRPLTNPDLSGANLSGANLRGFDLSGADLREANLSSANLANADLRAISGGRSIALQLLGTPVQGNRGYFGIGQADKANAKPIATPMGADLGKANLSGANLKGAAVDGANFSGCDLRGADLSTATGMTPEQIAVAVVDETTKLPLYLNF
jgi:uncharacterized protein YjbI with pentapeptide repeats